MEPDGKTQCVRPSTYVYIFVVEGPEHIEKTTWGLTWWTPRRDMNLSGMIAVFWPQDWLKNDRSHFRMSKEENLLMSTPDFAKPWFMN